MIFSKKTDSDGAHEDKATPLPSNAIDMLKKDHRTVKTLFKKLEDTDDDNEKVALAEEICAELTLHAEVEERVFYPAVREALREKASDLVDEATVEHRSLKTLIAEIDGSSPDSALFDANLKVLREYVEHHVKEEEHEMFPKLEGKLFDSEAVGARMAEVKADLLAKMGELNPPRTGAKLTVQVPALAGARAAASRAKPRSKSPGQSSKTTAAKAGNGRGAGNGAGTAAHGNSQSSHRA